MHEISNLLRERERERGAGWVAPWTSAGQDAVPGGTMSPLDQLASRCQARALVTVIASWEILLALPSPALSPICDPIFRFSVLFYFFTFVLLFNPLVV